MPGALPIASRTSARPSLAAVTVAACSQVMVSTLNARALCPVPMPEVFEPQPA
jgi:hypothetical protein